MIYSVGHSTRPIDELITILREAGVARVADVRAIPRSARHPQFNGDALARSLAAARIDYHHLPGLGGRRRSSKDAPPSRNAAWRVHAFRHYADYAATAPFRAALDELERLARGRPTAFMCAEAVWWRCHRRIITDYLIVRGWTVVHLLARDARQQGALSPAAATEAGGAIVYAGPDQPALPFDVDFARSRRRRS